MMCKGDNSTGRSFCRCDVTYVVKDNGECGQYIHVFFHVFFTVDCCSITADVLLLQYYCCCSIVAVLLLLQYYCLCSIFVALFLL